MRRILIKSAVCGAMVCGCAIWGIAANVQSVKTVYVLPMANGLDQYLAARLTATSVMQVVTDPQKADAVFTDHVGEAFEKSMDELFGSIPASKDGAATSTFARVGGSVRSRGTFFLVDRKTRDIAWSDEENPKGTDAKETRRMAWRIADHLGKLLKGK